jgi:NADPH-dependent ferric siderophore reductase
MPLLARVAVRHVERLSTSYLRVELAGPELADFGVDGPTYDQRIKILFPGPAGPPVLGASTWWADYQALPEHERGHVRTYTIRDVRGEGAATGIVVDFVLHPGSHGPGSSWAAAAEVGDELLAVVPRRGEQFGGIEWAPTDLGQLLVVADETAVPAVCSILESLPGDARGTAYLEVPVADDVQPVRAPAGVEVRWLPRNGAPVGTCVLAAVHAAGSAGEDEVDPDLWETPVYSSSGEALVPAAGEHGYAWVAGESAMVTAVRRHLVKDRGLPRGNVAFMGYWRIGVAMRA